MKKIFKVFGALLAFAMVIGLSSCGDMLNGTQNNGKDDEIGDVLEHTFVIDMADKNIDLQISVYYTSTKRFSYKNNDACYYQVAFNKQRNSWFMYTRPANSTNKISDVASGTYTGDIVKEGTLVLSSTEYPQYAQTVTLKTNSDGKLYFVANVASAHKFLGAKDEK